MARQVEHLHFLLVPLMSQSHIIPLTDFAKLLARHGVMVTIITTPVNAVRFKPVIDRATKPGLKIQLIPLRFPCLEAGLPEGCENMDSLTSPDLVKQFFVASEMLQQPLEQLIRDLKAPPSCIISTSALPWTKEVAEKFKIPRYVFQTVSCFTLLCSHSISQSKIDHTVDSDSEAFVIPNLPHKIDFTRSQLTGATSKNHSNIQDILDKIKQATYTAQGVLVNSFEGLEKSYAEEYKKVVNKLWCIGPVSLCNKEMSDKFDRGNRASIDEHHCLKWLDSMKPKSVIYACFGSLCRISFSQLVEIGMGLEASNRPFIWIINKRDYTKNLEKWLEEEDKFEERVRRRGLVIRGWAPQVLILSHSSVGAFLTHCGWNSTLEGVSAGVPMITWPMFAEQFFNEKFVVNVAKIGVRIGVEVGMTKAEEDEVLVKRERVAEAIEEVMDEEGWEGRERRTRVKELAEMAKQAIEQAAAAGSSYTDIMSLIQDVIAQQSSYIVD
ncbi:hypothetical protein LguiA_016053 [Lonicera macranthoides]